MTPRRRSLGLLVLVCGCTEGAAESDTNTKGCAVFEWYADEDGDGFGTGEATASCDGVAFTSLESGDCDDSVRSIHPGADEECNSLDDDCDGVVDNGVTTVLAAPDRDEDGYGDVDAGVDTCSVPAGWSTVVADCDDTDGEVSPAAVEVCNDVDDDCDGVVDDDDDDVVAATTWWLDGDGDGHGDPERDVLACDEGVGRSASGDDCDDSSSSVFPGAVEVCLDGIDQDCDGRSDDYSGACWPEEASSSLGCGAPPPQDGLCGGGSAAVGADGVTYATIQDALDSAQEGDAITVCPGTYSVALEPRVSGSLVGFGPGVSVLEGDGSGESILDVEYCELDLVGLSFESGDATAGGAVLTRAASLCIEEAAFAWNAASTGGAIWAPDSLGTIEAYGTLFAGNTANYGAALDGPLERADGVAFVSNVGYMGIVYARHPELTITNSIFEGNETMDAGALVVSTPDASEIEIVSTVFSRNTSVYYRGGALVIESTDSTVSCVDCSFQYNVGMIGGGAVAVTADRVALTISDSIFDGNAVSTGAGGAIFLDADDVSLAIERTAFSNNTADEAGGAISVDGGPVDVLVSGGSFNSNFAGTSGGAFELSEETTLTSTGVDWGSGGTDNAPDDVTGYTFGADATFVCIDLVCG